jgi:hypothetical protein
VNASAAPQLSRVRSFLLGALAVVWFSEMMFLGFTFLTKVWSHLWQVALPEDPQLSSVLYVTWRVAAPVKGALGVMAVFGLRSRSPFTRTALFASMALVPPLNIAFPFRQQGFLFGPVAVATTLSTILWGSFFLLREPAQPSERQSPRSRREILQDVWFAANAAALTLTALLLLFGTRTALNLLFPCLSGWLDANAGKLGSPIHTGMAAGTHLLALATAAWLATVYGRRHPTLRQAMTVALTVHAGLVCLFPLRQLFQQLGGSCAAASMLAPYVLVFVAWLVYTADSFRVTLTQSSSDPVTSP